MQNLFWFAVLFYAWFELQDHKSLKNLEFTGYLSIHDLLIANLVDDFCHKTSYNIGFARSPWRLAVGVIYAWLSKVSGVCLCVISTVQMLWYERRLKIERGRGACLAPFTLSQHRSSAINVANDGWLYIETLKKISNPPLQILKQP